LEAVNQGVCRLIAAKPAPARNVDNPDQRPLDQLLDNNKKFSVTFFRGITLTAFTVAAIALLFALGTYFPTLGRLNGDACDGWYYFGLMVSPGQAVINTGHQASRVALYLPFAFLADALKGVPLEKIFWFTNVILSASFTFAGLRCFVTPIAASSAAALTMCGIFSLTVMSTTYTAPSLTWGCIAFYFSSKSAFTSSRIGATLNTFLCGIFLGAAFNAHPASLLPFSTVPLLRLVPGYSRPNLMQILRDILVVAITTFIGFVAAAFIVEVISNAYFGIIGISLIQWRVVWAAATSKALGDWTYPDWWQKNSVIFFTILTIGCTLIPVARLTTAKTIKDRTNFYLALVGSGPFVFAYALTWLRGDWNLMWDYFILPFMLPLAVSLGAALDIAVTRSLASESIRSLRSFFLHLIGMCGSLALCLYLEWRYQIDPRWFYAALFAVAICFMLLLAGAKKRIVVFCFVLYVFLPIGFQSARGINYGGPFWNYNRKSEASEIYGATRDAVQYIDSLRGGQFPNFWIGVGAPRELVLPIFRSFCRCHFTPSFPNALPDAVEQWQHPLKDGELLIILASKEESIADAKGTLRKVGLDFVVSASKDFSAGRREIVVAVGSVVPSDIRAVSSSLQASLDPASILLSLDQMVPVLYIGPSLVSTAFDYVQRAWEVKTPRDVRADRVAEIGEEKGRLVMATNGPQQFGALVDRFAQEGGRLSELRRTVIREDRLSLGLFEMQAEIEPALEKRRP
jgi:hypothetical protein